MSFNIFPKALAILPFPNLWVLLYFDALVFLGIDTEFGYLETLFCYIKDEAKGGVVSIYGWELSLEKAKIGIVLLVLVVFGPFLTSSAGLYYLKFFDDFVPTIPLSLCAVIEYYIFVRIMPFS